MELVMQRSWGEEHFRQKSWYKKFYNGNKPRNKGSEGETDRRGDWRVSEGPNNIRTLGFLCMCQEVIKGSLQKETQSDLLFKHSTLAVPWRRSCNQKGEFRRISGLLQSSSRGVTWISRHGEKLFGLGSVLLMVPKRSL